MAARSTVRAALSTVEAAHASASLADLPGRVAADASALYARNLQAFAALLLNEEGQLEPDYQDEILKGALVVQGGQVVHPALRG